LPGAGLIFCPPNETGNVILFSIKTLPMMAFENLNSLEILNLQNNKLTRVPEEALEAIVDTATVIDIMGKTA